MSAREFPFLYARHTIPAQVLLEPCYSRTHPLLTLFHLKQAARFHLRAETLGLLCNGILTVMIHKQNCKHFHNRSPDLHEPPVETRVSYEEPNMESRRWVIYLEELNPTLWGPWPISHRALSSSGKSETPAPSAAAAVFTPRPQQQSLPTQMEVNPIVWWTWRGWQYHWNKKCFKLNSARKSYVARFSECQNYRACQLCLGLVTTSSPEF